MTTKVYMIDETLITALENTVPGSRHWHSIGTELRKYAKPKTESPAMALLWAFEFDYVEPTELERRERSGGYAPWFESKDGVFPPPLSKIDDKWLQVWAEAAERVKNAAVRSRLHDLLWERKWGDRPDLHARSAIDALIEVSKSSWDDLYRTQAITRAIELACQINDSARRDGAATRCIEEAERSMQEELRSKPGVTFRLIEGLMRIPSKNQPRGIDGLLGKAEAVYGNDPWHLQTVVDLKAQRTKDPERLKELRLQEIDKWREEAKSSDGLRKLFLLQKALELARDLGFSDIATAIRKEVQAITPDELDLQTATAKVEIPRAESEKFIKHFTERTDWKKCLHVFGSYGPPSGKHEENIRTVQEQKKKFPMQFFVSQAILGPGNVPIRTPSSDAEIEEAALVRQESLGISMWALFAADILEGVGTKFGRLSPKDLTAFFTTSLILDDIAERLSRALILFWDGHYDESAHLLVPRLEAIIRAVAREAGLPIIREPVADKPGGVRPLGDLLHSLKGRLNESWRRFLWNLLCDPIGTNLRNRIAHGLVPRASREEAAALIHAACFLRLLQVNKPKKKGAE